MGLIIPVVSSEPGPTYAVDINTSLSSIDSHNHTSGQGVAIPVSGLNINADLSFVGNNATNLRSTRYSSQASVLALPSDLGCIYLVGVDLYCNDGNGNNIRITQSGGIAGTSGSIANLVPPASAQYVAVSTKFIWQSDTSTAATMDFRNAILRNSSASSFGLTLSPPTAMPADYTITLPFAPAAQSFLAIDSSGNLTSVASVSAGIKSTNIFPGTITRGNINPSSLFPKLYSVTASSSGTFVVGSFSQIFVQGCGGGGGGGGGAAGTGGGGGGGGGSSALLSPLYSLQVVQGSTLNINIGAGGAAGAGGGGLGNGANGIGGASSYLSIGSTAVLQFTGANPGAGSTASAGAGGAGGVNINGSYTNGGDGGNAGGTGANGAAGQDTLMYVRTGGAFGAGNAGGGGGGGGGGAGSFGTGAAGGAGGQAAGNPAASAANTSYGAGGGGGGGSNNSGSPGSQGNSGGNGAAGIVYIFWTDWG